MPLQERQSVLPVEKVAPRVRQRTVELRPNVVSGCTRGAETETVESESEREREERKRGREKGEKERKREKERGRERKRETRMW